MFYKVRLVSLFSASIQSSSPSVFRIRPSGLFPVKIKLKIWISERVGRALVGLMISIVERPPLAHRRNSDKRQCLEWDSNPRSHCLN
jgi:hypothetical protein